MDQHVKQKLYFTEKSFEIPSNPSFIKYKILKYHVDFLNIMNVQDQKFIYLKSLKNKSLQFEGNLNYVFKNIIVMEQPHLIKQSR